MLRCWDVFFSFLAILFKKLVEIGHKHEYSIDANLRSWFNGMVCLAPAARSEIDFLVFKNWSTIFLHITWRKNYNISRVGL